MFPVAVSFAPLSISSDPLQIRLFIDAVVLEIKMCVLALTLIETSSVAAGSTFPVQFAAFFQLLSPPAPVQTADDRSVRSSSTWTAAATIGFQAENLRMRRR